MSETSVYQVPKRYPAAILLTRRENIENTHNNGKSRRKQQICLATTMLANAYTIVVVEVETKQS